jgi:hypothetical protein
VTDHEKPFVIRGMSIARGLLFNTPCTHHAVIKEYQRMLADVWSIDDGDAIHRDEFEQLVEELNETIATKYPDAVNRAGHTWRRQ